MDVTPHPKPGKRPRKKIRIHDKSATTRKLLADPTCRACGRPASNGDHIIQKGAPHFGDDVVENVAPLCGTGTSGCHGARHGSPYTDAEGKRWTPEEVRQREGLSLRDDEIAYILGKLGIGAGSAYLAREFNVWPIISHGRWCCVPYDDVRHSR